MNILIVKLSAIGDVIHALPVSRALKQTYPECRITWIVEKPAYDLLTNNPDIDELILFEKAKFKSFSGFFQNSAILKKQLKSKKFDVVLDLQGLFKSAALAWMSGASKRLGYCNMRELSGLISKAVCGPNQTGHVVERYLDVARALGCEVERPEWVITPSKEDKEKGKGILHENGLDIQDNYIVVAPGTNWQSKCWPAESYAKLADEIGQKLGVPIVLVGAPKDKELALTIQKNTQAKIYNIIGKTTLKQLAYIMGQSMLFIGGDTGPMHLAVAMDTPVITIFGPTDPVRNGPYGSDNIILKANISCSPCFKKNCPTVECMRQVSPEDVFQAILEITNLS